MRELVDPGTASANLALLAPAALLPAPRPTTDGDREDDEARLSRRDRVVHDLELSRRRRRRRLLARLA